MAFSMSGLWLLAMVLASVVFWLIPSANPVEAAIALSYELKQGAVGLQDPISPFVQAGGAPNRGSRMRTAGCVEMR